LFLMFGLKKIINSSKIKAKIVQKSSFGIEKHPRIYRQNSKHSHRYDDNNK
jgi:hypothetical protein